MSLLNKASLVLTPNSVKESKLYSIIPSNGNGDMAVTRATTATRVNSEGFIEEVPYNLNTYSQSIITTNGYFIDSLSNLIGNANISPNGTVTASRFEAKTEGTVDQFFYKTITRMISGVNYTYSLYLKLNTGGNGRIRLALFGANTIFNLANGTVVSGIGTISNVGNGWYRCSISAVSSSISTNIIVANGGTFLAGQGHLVWGAQLEQGSVLKDYFPTTDRLNVPRLNYDVAGGCPSILLEPQRTNLVLRSQEIGTTPWLLSVNTSIIQNSTSSLSPDKSNNATYVTATGQFGGVKQPVSIISGTTYTVSIWVKNHTSSNVLSFWLDSIQLNIGTFTPTTNWVKYSATFVATASQTSNLNFAQDRNASGFGSIWIWGAQLEQGAYPTSYIPTLASTVTRNADVISRNNIYTNGLITSAGGTWFVELNNNFSLIRDVSSRIGIGDNSNLITGNNLSLYIPSTISTRLRITKTVSNVFSEIYTTLTDNVKMTIKWNGVTADVFVNGVKVVSATSFTATIMEYLNGNAADVPKYIKSQLLFPNPLSDSECIQLTTL